MAATARTVDFTDVKEGGNFRPRRKPEGDYRAKIVKVDDHQPKDESKPMGWVATVQVDGDARSTYPFYLSPEKKQAWKVLAIARAAGFNLKNARVRFDPNKLVGKSIGVALVDDEYEGKVKSTIDDVFSPDEVGPTAEVDVEDEVEEVLDDEVEGDYDEEPEEEEEPEPAPAPKKRATRRKPAPEPEPEEDEEDDEEDEEEPPPPPKRTRKAAAAPAPKRRKPTPPPVEDDEDDDLDDLDTDDLD